MTFRQCLYERQQQIVSILDENLQSTTADQFLLSEYFDIWFTLNFFTTNYLIIYENLYPPIILNQCKKYLYTSIANKYYVALYYNNLKVQLN